MNQIIAYIRGLATVPRPSMVVINLTTTKAVKTIRIPMKLFNSLVVAAEIFLGSPLLSM